MGFANLEVSLIRRDQTIVAQVDIDLQLKAVQPINNLAAGPHRYPYASLPPAGFELLLYSLYQSGAARNPVSDSVTMSPPGGDGGRDLRLGLDGKPVGIVQCKKVDRRLPAPTVLREIVKFLLNVELDSRQLPDPEGFTYVLALSRDPAKTTVSFFESPKAWLAGHQDQIGNYVRQLTTDHARMRPIGWAEATPRIFERLSNMRYTLLRPADLDELLDAPQASQTKLRFFRHVPVIDLEGAGEMVTRGLAKGGLLAPLQPLTRQERKTLAWSVSRRVADTLDHTGLYKRGRTIERAAFVARVREFLGTDKRIFPVVGLSGVGKTSAMAWLAERGEEPLPSLLLVRGAWINKSHLGIRDLLEALPWTEAGYPGGGQFAVEEMFASEPPLILLDGLNEASADAEHIRNSWIPNSLDWLSQRGAKLVVTCRPEHWDGWHDAFPLGGLHLLSIEQAPVTLPIASRRKSRDAPADTDRAAGNSPSLDASDPVRVFQLSDFSETEAAEALAAYGLQDRLSVAQARHPFLLEVAQLVDLTRAPQDLAIEFVLESFLERRVARALARRERTVLVDETVALLSAMAEKMYAARAQVIAPDAARVLARDIPEAIDCLVEEHLLLRDREGFRFQQDQVREHLQARLLTANDIVREVRPAPIERSKRWIDQVRFAIAKAFARTPSRHDAERQRNDGRVLQPSVAARAIVRMLRESEEIERTAPVLDALFDATDPALTDATAEWAFRTILIILGICPPAALDHEFFVAWLKRLMLRPNKPWLKTWQEQIQRGMISLLTRSENRISLKLELLAGSIGRDREFGWEPTSLKAGAGTEMAMRESTPSYRHYDHLLSIATSGALIEHVVATHPQSTIALMIEWLVDTTEPKKQAASEGLLALTSAAAISLYHFRDAAIERVVSVALDEHTPAATSLLDALVISNPDEVVSEALSRVGVASDRERLRLRRAIWLAFHYTKSADDQIMGYAYDGMADSEGEELVWALRIFFLEYEYRLCCLARYPNDQPTARLVAALEDTASRYSHLLQAHLTHNPEEIQIADDYSYLLQMNFEGGVELLEQMCVSDAGLSATALAGIRHHLKPARLHEEGCLDRYVRLAAILDRYLDRHGTLAVNRISDFVVRTAEHAGMNHFEFDEATMIELGFLEMAKRVIAHGGDYVGRLCGSMNWPIGERPRTELLAAVAKSPIADAHFENLIFSLLCGRMHSEYCFERLQALRIEARRGAWDEAGLRYLRVSVTGPHKDLSVLRYWRTLPSEELTDISSKIVSWVNEGYSVGNAIIAVMHTHPVTIRSILGAPNKMSSVDEDDEA